MTGPRIAFTANGTAVGKPLPSVGGTISRLGNEFFIFFDRSVGGFRMAVGRINATRRVPDLERHQIRQWRPSHAPRFLFDLASRDSDHLYLDFNARSGPRAVEEGIGPNEQSRTRDVEPPNHVDFEKGRFHYHSELR
jgi:hypothetical protein